MWAMRESFLTGTVYLFNLAALNNEKLFASLRKQSSLLAIASIKKTANAVFSSGR